MRQFQTALASAVAAIAVTASPAAFAQDIKIGVLLGFTGPLEALAPPIAAGAELALTQVNDQGGILDGRNLVPVRGDSTCADATAAANAADRLINTEGVSAIVGAMCSGATASAANVAGIPSGTVMISPSATGSLISTLADNDLVFRTATSDGYNGEVLARIIRSKGIDDIVITYVNNDYGKGLADTLEAAFMAEGGTVAAKEQHEEGKADYRAEIGSLAATGSLNLAVLAYAQGSGQTLLRQAIESGNFVTYIGADGMVSDDLFVGMDVSQLEGMIADKPADPAVAGAVVFAEQARAAGLDPTAIFSPQAYDGAFLLALALERNGGSKDGLAAAVRAVATAPGEVILPGEWAKAKAILAAGGDVDYEGATGPLEFDASGDVPGAVVEMVVQNGMWVEVGPAS